MYVVYRSIRMKEGKKWLLQEERFETRGRVLSSFDQANCGGDDSWDFDERTNR